MQKLDLYMEKIMVVWADTLKEYQSAYDTADDVVSYLEKGCLLVKRRKIPNPRILQCAQMWKAVDRKLFGIRMIQELTGCSLKEATEFYDLYV